MTYTLINSKYNRHGRRTETIYYGEARIGPIRQKKEKTIQPSV